MAIVLLVTLLVFWRTTTLALCIVAPGITILVKHLRLWESLFSSEVWELVRSAGRGRVRDSRGVYNLWLLEVAYGGPKPCFVLLLVL